MLVIIDVRAKKTLTSVKLKDWLFLMD